MISRACGNLVKSTLIQCFMHFKLLVIFVLVNYLNVLGPLEANKTQEICIFQ